MWFPEEGDRRAPRQTKAEAPQSTLMGHLTPLSAHLQAANYGYDHCNGLHLLRETQQCYDTGMRRTLSI